MFCFKNIINELNNIIFLSYAEHGQMGLQEPGSEIMCGLIRFHGHLLVYITIISLFVFILLYFIYIGFKRQHPYQYGEKFAHSNSLEIIWTIIPAFVLLLIAAPSFALLYAMEDMITSDLLVQVLGHQWYWTYQVNQYYLGFPTFSFDSYLFNNLVPKGSSYFVASRYGQPRLLTVDRTLSLPTNKYLKFLVTSADVLHSFAVPGLGLKLDACPGRLVSVTSLIIRPGLYFGQCSEICGVNHAFMPITIVATNVTEWIDWYTTQVWLWEQWQNYSNEKQAEIA